MRRTLGFTMIELLIVMAVVAILAAIAYPSYLNQMRKSNRAEAQAYLMDLANREQQYLIDKRSYAGTEAALNQTTPLAVQKFYTLTAPFCNASGAAPLCATAFSIQAVPISTTIQASDYTLQIDQNGTRTATDSGGTAVPNIW